MSYPRDLDDYSEKELRDEISRREVLAKKGLCTYCEGKRNTTPCQYPARHKGREL